MAKKLLYLNVWDAEEFKEPWRQKEFEMMRARTITGFHEEFEDLEAVTSQLLQKGQNAAEIFAWGLPAIPSFIKSKVGKEGQVYSIDGDSDCELELFFHFIEMQKSLRRIERGEEADSHYHNRGTVLRHIRNKGYMLQLEEAISKIDMAQANRLARDRKKPEAKKGLLGIARQFYALMGIEPLTQVLPPYPEKLGEGSVDAVFEHNGFAFCLERQKEDIISGADKILKPGGYLAFKDIPMQLATVQYYGEDIFNERYAPVVLPGLNNPFEWLVLQKQG